MNKDDEEKINTSAQKIVAASTWTDELFFDFIVNSLKLAYLMGQTAQLAADMDKAKKILDKKEA